MDSTAPDEPASEKTAFEETETDIEQNKKGDIQPTTSAKRKLQDEELLEEVCRNLAPNDLVPNSRNLQVTLSQILAMTEKNEGFVDYIASHRENKDGVQYLVKWIGYIGKTWECEEYVPPEAVRRYYSTIPSKKLKKNQ